MMTSRALSAAAVVNEYETDVPVIIWALLATFPTPPWLRHTEELWLYLLTVPAAREAETVPAAHALVHCVRADWIHTSSFSPPGDSACSVHVSATDDAHE